MTMYMYTRTQSFPEGWGQVSSDRSNMITERYTTNMLYFVDWHLIWTVLNSAWVGLNLISVQPVSDNRYKCINVSIIFMLSCFLIYSINSTHRIAKWTSDFVHIQTEKSWNILETINVTLTFGLAPEDYGFVKYKVFLCKVIRNPGGESGAEGGGRRGGEYDECARDLHPGYTQFQMAVSMM